MPFNGNGTFSRIYSWVVDAANNVNISSSRTDAEMNGFAAGLTNCITRDGQSPPSADIPWGAKRITNLGAATVGTDALNRDTADARYVTPTSGDARYVTPASGDVRYLTATTPIVTGTTLWVNTNKLLVQHDGTNGFIRSQVGNLNLGANGSTSLILDAAGGVTANAAMNVVGGLSHNGNTVWDAANLTSSSLNSIYGYTPAPLASPSLTGTPIAPTAAAGTATTQLATTAFVDALRDVPSNAKAANYALALTDRGGGVDFNGTSLTCTIPANASVAFPLGTTIILTNLNATALSIAITTDTLTLAGSTTTGTRTLAQNGIATLRKVGATSWLISGAGLS